MAVCCQNLPLGAFSSRSAPSVLVGEPFKKFGLFFEHTHISAFLLLLTPFPSIIPYLSTQSALLG